MQAALPGYEIGNEIGRGAFGVVYRGRHRQLGREVAIKQLPRALAADPTVQQRFLIEARTVAALQHPHIVQVYDFVERDGLYLMVMAHLDGGTLADRLERDRLSPDEACRTMADVLDALDHAHRNGVVHRDVKPENILFTADGRVQLSDFGIARIVGDSAKLTSGGAVMGTPAYMAPEVAMGDEAGPAADVYAAAAVLYEALAGTLPHPPRDTATATLVRVVNEPPVPLSTAAPHVPARLADLVMEALAKDPAARPASAAAFAAQLRAIASVPSAAASPALATAAPSGVAPVARIAASQPPRSRSRIIVAAVAVLALVAVAGVVLATRGDDDAGAAGTDGSTAASVLDTEAPGSSAATETTVEITTTTGTAAPTTTDVATAGGVTTVAGTQDTADAAPADSAPLSLEDLGITLPLDDIVEATDAFQLGCDSRGVTPTQCQCMITQVTDQFGVARFITVANALASGVSIRKEVMSVLTSCLAAT